MTKWQKDWRAERQKDRQDRNNISLDLRSQRHNQILCTSKWGRAQKHTLATPTPFWWRQCLALMVFNSKGCFTCHTYCDTGPLFSRSYPKDLWFLLLNAVLLAKEQSLPIFNVVSLTLPARARLERTTSRMLIESTTTRLLQLVQDVQGGAYWRQDWSKNRFMYECFKWIQRVTPIADPERTLSEPNISESVT
jgi:hypothetical protein